jgi:hypothetical protein
MVERFQTQLVLRRPLQSLDPAALARHLATVLSGAGPEAAQLVSTEWPVMLQLGPEMLVAMRVEAPLPGVEELAAGAWWWPEAAAVLQGHAAHLILWAMGAEKPGLAGIAAARSVTRFTAALAAAVGEEVLAVVWGASGALWSPAQFVAAAGQALPVMLWVRIDLVPGASAAEVGAATRGLRAFLDRELRLEPTALLAPAQVVQRCQGLATYLLGGATVQEGDTIGIDTEERIRLRRDEDAALGGPVLSLTVERASP